MAAFEQVLQITRDMVATTDLDELLGVILDSSMKLLSAERATLFLYEPDTDEFVSRIAHGAEEIRFGASVGIAGAAGAGKEVLNIPDAYADERFNQEVDRETGYRTRNILAAPLRDHDGELVGVLEVLNKLGGPFTPEDVILAETLGAQAGVVLQRARLMEHYVEKQRMAQALSIARTIQQDQLPREEPCIEGFDVSGASWPADETGGDVFDWMDLGDGRLT
ncbi:MAG: GAF domain-containing protein, partial [Planctomycetota bacterium]